MLFGAHVSGGVRAALDRAADIGADAVQLFVQSPRTWRFPAHDPADLKLFRERYRRGEFAAVTCHAIYLVNLASPDDEIYGKSLATLANTLAVAREIEADVVFHVGSHQGAGLEAGLERAVPALEQVVSRCTETTRLLVENSAGAGGTIGRSLDELETILDRLGRHPHVGVCLDSCHLYASGYDVTDRSALDAVLDELDGRIGLDRLLALHVNDSKAPLASNRDRHDNIGEGLMGEKLGVFLAHPRLQGLPAILEVPGKDGRGPDADELRKLRELHARWTKEG